MKRTLALFSGALLLALGSVHAAEPSVKAAIAVDENTRPTDTFSADTPKLIAFFLTEGTKKGDVVHCVWIATDVGDAAPANTKIDESSLTAEKDDFSGGFSLSKPTAGWPLGTYRVEMSLNDKLATTAPFHITAAKASDEEPAKADDAEKSEESPKETAPAKADDAN